MSAAPCIRNLPTADARRPRLIRPCHRRTAKPQASTISVVSSRKIWIFNIAYLPQTNRTKTSARPSRFRETLGKPISASPDSAHTRHDHDLQVISRKHPGSHLTTFVGEMTIKAQTYCVQILI